MSGRASADGALLGARIHTLDPARPLASAVAWRAGTIVAVGDDDEVRGACDARTELVDGAGAVLTPGLVDSHMHALWATELSESNALGADLSGVRTLDELRAALAQERARVGDGGWVRGWGLIYEAFGDGPIHRREIEGVLDGAPALLRFFDAHTVLTSGRALELAGVDGPRTFEGEEGEVVCEDGVPTGELREQAAMDLVGDVAPKLTDDERRARSAELQRALNAVGLTGAHVMDGDGRSVALLERLEERGEQSVRMVVPMWIDPATTVERQRELVGLFDRRGRLWRCGTAKFFVDGVIETGTAWLERPDVDGGGVLPFWPEPERYDEAVARFAQAGFQCITHAIGDRAVRAALEAYAAAGAAPGVRHRVEHVETLDADGVRRFARSGAIASMQPIHLSGRRADGSDEWTRRLGPERVAHGYPFGSLLRAGVTVALGSDWPVASFDPRVGMAWARLRRAPGAREAAPFEPEQRLSPLEALRGYTTAAAEAVGEQALGGRVAPGLRADLTGFAGDPLAVDADDLPDLPVRLTVVDGRVVFAAERRDAAPAAPR